MHDEYVAQPKQRHNNEGKTRDVFALGRPAASVYIAPVQGVGEEKSLHCAHLS